MDIGDRVRIQPAAWNKHVQGNGVRPGQKFNPGAQSIEEVSPQGDTYRLTEPSQAWWGESDLILADEAPGPSVGPVDAAAITRAFCAVMEMWGRRYEYEVTSINPKTLPAQSGEEISATVGVEYGTLAVAHSELLKVIRVVNPDLYRQLLAPGGSPDAPLPPDPSTVAGEAVVTNLDEVRIRMGQEFRDETIAYVEAIWGRDTYAFNAAIQDLEARRRGAEGGELRRPETYHEGMHLVLHVRALANDLARNFGMDHLIREDDDLGEK